MQVSKNLKYYLGLSFIPALILYGVWRQHQLKDHMYTIGYTKRQLSTLKNGLQIEYHYNINGQEYKSFAFKDERKNIVYPNGRYLVSYSLNYPDISEIFWDKPIPDYLNNAPVNGWDAIPVGISKD